MCTCAVSARRPCIVLVLVVFALPNAGVLLVGLNAPLHPYCMANSRVQWRAILEDETCVGSHRSPFTPWD